MKLFLFFLFLWFYWKLNLNSFKLQLLKKSLSKNVSQMPSLACTCVGLGGLTEVKEAGTFSQWTQQDHTFGDFFFFRIRSQGKLNGKQNTREVITKYSCKNPHKGSVSVKGTSWVIRYLNYHKQGLPWWSSG